MKNYWMQISYIGTKFYGMARQPNKITIQSEIENNLSTLLNKDIKINYSGRTDRDVHAKNQYVNFLTDNANIDVENIRNYLNLKLDWIYIKKVWIDSNIQKHARFDAKEKTYEYIIDNSNEYDIFLKESAYWIQKEIDINLIMKASEKLIGYLDFASFTSKTEYEDYKREITDISISENKNHLINIKITGKGFMRYMARNIVGALIDVGIGKLHIDELNKMIVSPKRGANIHKAPGYALYLYDVKY